MSIWDERTGLDEDDDRAPLRRSGNDRVICGVCGGIGRATGADPTIIRLAAVVLTIVGAGWTIPAYFIAAIFMKRSPHDWDRTRRRARRASRATAGWALVVIGAVLLLQRLHTWVDTGLVLALVMVVVGINLVLRNRD